jgi:hypothetical protein
MSNRSNLILMTIVCLGPPLNLIFDYFVLKQLLNIGTIISTVVAIVIYSVYLYIYIKHK